MSTTPSVQAVRFVDGPYDGQEFPGSVFDPRCRVWSIPVDEATYRLLRGEKLHIERHADLFEKQFGMAAVYRRVSEASEPIVTYQFVKSVSAEEHRKTVAKAQEGLRKWKEAQANSPKPR